jgi:uncharacterized protein YbjT (DUF2867 family)
MYLIAPTTERCRGVAAQQSSNCREVRWRGFNNGMLPRMAGRSAAVAGATGLVGGHLLAQLLADDDYQRVVALVRKSPALTHAKLEVREVDFDRIGEQARGLEVQDVFCALGTTIKKAGSEQAFRKVDLEYVRELAAALRPTAEQFLLVSSLGASARSGMLYNRTKGEVEQAVAQLSFRGGHVFRPSFLEGERAERRIGEKIGTAFAHAVGVLPIGPLRRIRPVQARVVAAAMIRVAKRDEPGWHVYESDEIRAMFDGE